MMCIYVFYDHNNITTESCSPLPEIGNGTVVYSDEDYAWGSTASYVCNSGFRLNSSMSRTCTQDGTTFWTGVEPTCLNGNFPD